uniref:Uncharacterized protein n=1 Tax=Panagrolaimus davidi TaxID=227884 RepID=A0A914QEC0_9BILA
MNVNSMEDIPEYQQENLRIENEYAIIEMKAGDDFSEYNASLLLNQNESLRFIFNLNYTDQIYNFLNLTLKLSEHEPLTVQLAYAASRISQKITFYNKRENDNYQTIGEFDNYHFMSFEFFPNGTLTNNGTGAVPKIFPFSDAEVQEEDGKRRFDFSISWKNKVYGEFMIVSFFFLLIDNTRA